MRPQIIYIALALSVATAIFSVTARAEVYRDIGPMDSYAMVKAKFPGAKTETLTPAWLGEQEWLHQITGNGLSGTIVIKSSPSINDRLKQRFLEYFEHMRDSLVAEDHPADSLSIRFYSAAADSFSNAVYRNLSVDEDSATVDWVRWIPDSPVRVDYVIEKFGTGYVRKFSDEDMQPYFEWTARGVVATLSDDQLSVVNIEYAFTPKDWDEARRVRGLGTRRSRRPPAKTGKPGAPVPVVTSKPRKIPKM